MGRDAFGAGDVHESVVAGLRALSSATSRIGFELFAGVEKALVTARNVVIHLDAEHIGIGGAADDLVGVVEPQAVPGDADVMGPVLAGLATQEASQTNKCRESS